jgi:hypothetical protein
MHGMIRRDLLKASPGLATGRRGEVQHACWRATGEMQNDRARSGNLCSDWADTSRPVPAVHTNQVAAIVWQRSRNEPQVAARGGRNAVTLRRHTRRPGTERGNSPKTSHRPRCRWLPIVIAEW